MPRGLRPVTAADLTLCLVSSLVATCGVTHTMSGKLRAASRVVDAHAAKALHCALLGGTAGGGTVALSAAVSAGNALAAVTGVASSRYAGGVRCVHVVGSGAKIEVEQDGDTAYQHLPVSPTAFGAVTGAVAAIPPA